MSSEKYYQSFLEHNKYPRILKPCDPISAMHVRLQGRELINFSSSDYLGLSHHPLLIEGAYESTKQWGMGAGASRLVTGNISLYDTLEKKIAVMMRKPSALIMGSGYQTNSAVLEALLNPTVLGKKALVFCDRFCHASLLSTISLMTDIKPFRHNDCDHLEALLKKYEKTDSPKTIIVESLYSMDGDIAPLERIVALAKQYQAFLYVDDAHAVGVYGDNGCGIAAAFADGIDIIMGTFSKALGSFGGYIACSDVCRDYLINTCKGLIYATAMSPAVLGAMDAALDVLPSMDEARARLAAHAIRVRQCFDQQKIEYGASSTHIIPWIIGGAEKTVTVSQQLEERGILGICIRPPSVKVGKSRIRFCLSAVHSDEDIETLLEAVISTGRSVA